MFRGRRVSEQQILNLWTFLDDTDSPHLHWVCKKYNNYISSSRFLTHRICYINALHRCLMGPYLVQWMTIQNGSRTYCRLCLQRTLFQWVWPQLSNTMGGGRLSSLPKTCQNSSVYVELLAIGQLTSLAA